ncbi:hypothetical protein SSS_09919 [Sarcoptes scabiei]|nr:hypothetical protein SSS_09919 [Sarcoptes scabiei]
MTTTIMSNRPSISPVVLNSKSLNSFSSIRRSISTPNALFAIRSTSTENGPTSNRGFKQNSPVSLHRLVNKVTAENLAKQITLIDWVIFSKINRNELKPGQWTGPMKHVLSPNVVLFTRRFNIITFWVIDEILALETPKQRSELMSFLIKLTNYLIELRNLHSSYAIKSALTSAPIHRLEKSWNCLSKKDRQNFSKISQLFSESDNSHKLRTFMEMAVKQSSSVSLSSTSSSTPSSSRNTNCIPNLATYLRDIIHIDSAYPQNDIRLANYRLEKLESIFTFIEKCQQSTYDEIKVIQDVYNYLVSLRYIEELQKFREDDNYKTSLRLEPDLNNESKNRKMICFSSHYDIRSLQQSTQQQHSSISKSHNQSSLELNKLDVKDNENVFNHSFNIGSRSSTRSSSSDTGFKPGHRKTYSLGTSQFYSSSNPGTPISSRQQQQR